MCRGRFGASAEIGGYAGSMSIFHTHYAGLNHLRLVCMIRFSVMHRRWFERRRLIIWLHRYFTVQNSFNLIKINYGICSCCHDQARASRSLCAERNKCKNIRFPAFFQKMWMNFVPEVRYTAGSLHFCARSRCVKSHLCIISDANLVTITA